MPRPKICRHVTCTPGAVHFKPQGVPVRQLDVAILGLDEIEALRLADLEGLTQEQAAERMGVSRATFGRIVASAHRTVAMALTEGKALRIEGGPVKMLTNKRTFECSKCNHRWEEPRGTGRPEKCPQCGSQAFFRAADERGPGGNCNRHGQRRGRRAGAAVAKSED